MNVNTDALSIRLNGAMHLIASNSAMIDGRTDIRLKHFVTALPTPGYDKIRISGDCSYYWGTAAWQ